MIFFFDIFVDHVGVNSEVVSAFSSAILFTYAEIGEETQQVNAIHEAEASVGTFRGSLAAPRAAEFPPHAGAWCSAAVGSRASKAAGSSQLTHVAQSFRKSSQGRLGEIESSLDAQVGYIFPVFFVFLELYRNEYFRQHFRSVCVANVEYPGIIFSFTAKAESRSFHCNHQQHQRTMLSVYQVNYLSGSVSGRRGNILG